MAIYSVWMRWTTNQVQLCFDNMIRLVFTLERRFTRLKGWLNFSLYIISTFVLYFFFFSFFAVFRNWYKHLQCFDHWLRNIHVSNFAVTLQITTPIIMQRSKRRSKSVCSIQKNHMDDSVNDSLNLYRIQV